MKEEAKKPVDFFKKFAKKTPVQTSQGIVYTRPLMNGRWSSISSSDDAATVGEAVLRALTGPEEKTGDETVLTDDVFEYLSSDDIQNLASSVAKANGLGDLPAEKPPAEGLGELILTSQQKTRDAMQRVIDQTRSSILLGNTWSSDLKIPDLNIPDFSNSPINRAAAASEQAAEQTAAGLLLWKQQLESDKQAAAESKKQAEENIAVAKASQKIAEKSQQIAQKSMWVTIGVALVTLAAQIGQFFWSERGTAEERAQQAETERLRHEATLQVLREQLSAQQQLLSTQPHTPLSKNKGTESRK